VSVVQRRHRTRRVNVGLDNIHALRVTVRDWFEDA
jgi:hypothetical protein